MVIIPCRPDLTHYEMQITLEGVGYGLEFRWNTREEAWYMHLYGEDGTPIRMGVKVVVGFPLVARLNADARPRGRFVAFDTTNLDRNPGIADLGDRVTLAYFDADEVAELGG